MNIKVLGTGCAKCHALEKAVKDAVNEMKIDATIEDIKDIKKIMDYQILFTPGLIINEKIVSTGTVPSKQEVMKYINEAMNQENNSR
jgi:small redox-active disulfide protein 2